MPKKIYRCTYSISTFKSMAVNTCPLQVPYNITQFKTGPSIILPFSWIPLYVQHISHSAYP